MDIQVIDEVTIFVFRPCSDAGREFLRNEAASEGRQWRGEVLYVKRNLAEGLTAAAVADGLQVSGDVVIADDDDEADG